MVIMDITDSRQPLILVVRSVRWKDVQRQEDIHMMAVNTAGMIMKVTTVTVLVQSFIAVDTADMAVIVKDDRSPSGSWMGNDHFLCRKFSGKSV